MNSTQSKQQAAQSALACVTPHCYQKSNDEHGKDKNVFRILLETDEWAQTQAKSDGIYDHHHHFISSIIQSASATISAHIEQDRKALIEHQ